MTKFLAKLLKKKENAAANEVAAACQAAMVARMDRVLHLDGTPAKAG